MQVMMKNRLHTVKEQLEKKVNYPDQTTNETSSTRSNNWKHKPSGVFFVLLQRLYKFFCCHIHSFHVTVFLLNVHMLKTNK